jgi:Pepsin inhibitor-3-like repeated domain
VAEKNAQGETLLATDTVLVAYVTVHLEDGETFELLPFEDTHDVKSKVSDLVEAWARSGCLVRGNRIYPWHRVRRLEATKVEELKLYDAQLRREQWQAQETERLLQSFWQTKEAREKRNEDENGGGAKPAV